MNNAPDLVTRIQKLDEAVALAVDMQDGAFREAFCDLIRSVPLEWHSEARDLCLDDLGEYGASVIEHLQHDIDTHADDLDYTRIFYPLMRLAVTIRTAELRHSI